MKTYVITTVCLLALEVVGNVVMVYQCETRRNPSHTAINAVLNAALAAWGFYLLGT